MRHAYPTECIDSSDPHLADTLASATPRRLEHDWQANAVGALHRLLHCVHACLLVEVIRDVPALIRGQLNLNSRSDDNEGVISTARAQGRTCRHASGQIQAKRFGGIVLQLAKSGFSMLTRLLCH